MYLIILIIAAACSSYCLIEVVGLHMILKRLLRWKGRIKPFDCLQCLTFWCFVLLYFVPSLQFIGYGFIAMYLTTRK